MTSLIFSVCSTIHYWHYILCSLYSVYAVQHTTGLVFCVHKYKIAMVLYSVYAGQYAAGLVLCVYDAVGDQPDTQCMQYNA
jgi:hypothetical protein